MPLEEQNILYWPSGHKRNLSLTFTSKLFLVLPSRASENKSKLSNNVTGLQIFEEKKGF